MLFLVLEKCVKTFKCLDNKNKKNTFKSVKLTFTFTDQNKTMYHNSRLVHKYKIE